jgi:hypothetical protein
MNTSACRRLKGERVRVASNDLRRRSSDYCHHKLHEMMSDSSAPFGLERKKERHGIITSRLDAVFIYTSIEVEATDKGYSRNSTSV